MKTKLFLLLLIIAITTSLSAQEKLTAEEMFRWFPEGKYDEVEHYDLETAQGLPGFHKFLKGRNKTVARWTHDIQMPSELKDKFSSVTTMTTVRIVVHKGKDAPAMGRGGKTSGARFGDQIYTANSFGIKMITVRTDGNLNLKKSCLHINRWSLPRR